MLDVKEEFLSSIYQKPSVCQSRIEIDLHVSEVLWSFKGILKEENKTKL